jgi:hypothetical protein
MSLYSIALFLHVVGALALFAALALEWVGLAGLRRATTAEQAAEWGGIWPLLARLAPAALATLLVSGIYMAVVAWGRNAWWIALGLVGLFLLGGLGARNGRRLRELTLPLTARRGPLDRELRAQLASSQWWGSMRVREVVAVGVIFLMTVKPALAGSLITMGLALALGLLWARSGTARENGEG